MSIDDTTYKALEWCIYKQVPFAMYAMPGKERAHFWAAPSLIGSDPATWTQRPADGGFFITPFCRSIKQSCWIPRELNAVGLMKNRFSIPNAEWDLEPLELESTSHDEYVARVGQLVKGRLAESVINKTVISIIRTEDHPGCVAAEMADELFDMHPETFRSCLFHPATGFWMGATPELMLSCDKAHGRFKTMALAGTMPVWEEEWDDKNLIEHSIVSAFVIETLERLGIKKIRRERVDVRYGDLAHFGNLFTGSIKGTGITPEDVIDSLNPTPALCGNPTTEALKDICDIEDHDRECYGGLVGVDAKNELNAFVNIRCMRFQGSRFRFYGGGGVISSSDPEEEWLEANRKIDNASPFQD